MKSKLLCALVAAVPLAFVSAAVQAQATPAKPAAKSAAKPGAKSKAPVPQPRLARSAVKAVEEVTPIDDDPNVTLSEADLAVAKRIYIGHIPCELGAAVQITAAKREGFFIVQVKDVRNARYLMHPVESRTGAIRLEDPKRGALWLQLGNKSMLMSQKLGLRLADECASPEQITLADEMKKNPPRSLLEPADAPRPAASAADLPSGAPSARTP